MKALCILLLLCALSLHAAGPRPNIIFIFADDFGWGDLHCYGHPYARTPNLDKLASEGTRFTQFYATGVTCCPSRTGFMSGRHPASYPTYPAVGGFGERPTITALLKKAGYRTGHFGKWHIGPNTEPGTYGIDVIGGDGERRRDAEGGRDTPIYDQAIQFIEQNREGPFYLNVWGHITHNPINPAQKFVDEFKDVKVNEADFGGHMRSKFEACRKLGGDVDDAMRHYLGDVWSMDQDIGRLLAKLDELKLRESTLVVFSSDQGPGGLELEDGEVKIKKKAKDAERQNLRLNQMGYTGGLRGGKHRQYEGGVRIPFILRWPGHTPAGRVDKESVLSGMDWLPTLCAITETALPSGDFDGEDTSKAWLGGTHVRKKPLFWKTSSPNSDPAIRLGNWKFHGSNRRKGEVELYDLASDPEERLNLAEKHPEVVTRLSSTLAAWAHTLPAEYVKGEGKDDDK
ncbi:MAG: sulfatase [Prosthecobacter sp.]